MHDTNTGLILFAHGARDPAWANSMRAVQAEILARQPGSVVELAFLEFLAPNLPDCVASLVAAGLQKIVVIPMFIAQGGHLKREVPELLALLRSTYPEVSISLAPVIGEQESVIHAMANAALALQAQ